MGRSILSVLAAIVVIASWHYGLAQSPYSQSDEDPVRCFDNALRDEQNALQAYQIVTGSNWRTDFDCRGRVAAPELDSCWSMLLQIRPMIEAAAEDYERARHVMEPTSGQLVHEGNSVMQQAAVLWQQASRCFAPIFDRWTKNGGRYVANQGNQGKNASGPPQGESCGTSPGYVTREANGTLTLHCGVADAPPPSTGNSGADASCAASYPSPGIQQQLLDGARQLDAVVTEWQDRALVAGDHFFAGMGQAVKDNLLFLAQRPGLPAQQIGDAVIRYLLNDNAANHAMLYAAAQQGVATLQRDPAYGFGYVAGNQLIGEAMGSVCRGATNLIARRAQAIEQTEQAATRLGEMEKLAEIPGSAPICTPRKVDCFWRALRDLSGDPALDAKLNGPPPASWGEVYANMQKYFGGNVRGARFPAAHQLGLFEAMTVDEIIQDLTQAGSGSEGMVIVFWKNGGSHAFQATNLGGYVSLIDDQKQFWSASAGQMTVQQALGSNVSSSMFFRTR